MGQLGILVLLSLIGISFGTPETTDFDLYHPYRHIYLVKNTLLGGGNFVNKLKPGFIYVWDGINHDRDRRYWYVDNPWTGKHGFYGVKHRVFMSHDSLHEENSPAKENPQNYDFGYSANYNPDPCKWLLRGPATKSVFKYDISTGGEKVFKNHKIQTGGNVPRYLRSHHGNMPYFGVPEFSEKQAPYVDCAFDTTFGTAKGDTEFSKPYARNGSAAMMDYPFINDGNHPYPFAKAFGRGDSSFSSGAYEPSISETSKAPYKVVAMKKHPVSMTLPSKYFLSVVQRFLDPTKRPCNYPHLCSADDPYYHGNSIFAYWMNNLPSPSFSAEQLNQADAQLESYSMKQWNSANKDVPWKLPSAKLFANFDAFMNGHSEFGDKTESPNHPGVNGVFPKIIKDVRVKTGLLAPVLNVIHWSDSDLMSPLHPAVRSWEPRNKVIATGEKNGYITGDFVNKALYPVMHSPWMRAFKKQKLQLIRQGPFSLYNMLAWQQVPFFGSDAFMNDDCIDDGAGCMLAASKFKKRDDAKYVNKYANKGNTNSSMFWPTLSLPPNLYKDTDYRLWSTSRNGLSSDEKRFWRPKGIETYNVDPYFNSLASLTTNHNGQYRNRMTQANNGDYKSKIRKPGPFIGGRKGFGRITAGGMSNNMLQLVNKIKGNSEWTARTEQGTKFTYAYSAGCWTKLPPDDYGMDVPESKWSDPIVDQYISSKQLEEIKEEHKLRKDNNNKQKYENNEALKKWWNMDYGERNFFSLRDAITQKRCNGDEMLWYLFYSRPSKMDEFCENTVFGNKIPKDFCKNNPPSYWNWMVTEKNLKIKNDKKQNPTEYDSSAQLHFNDCVEQLKNDIRPHTARIALPTQINECLRKKVKVIPNRGPNKDTKVTHFDRFGGKWIFTGFSKWNGKRQDTVFYKSSSLNKYNNEYIAWGNARNARLSVPRQTSSAAQNLIHFILPLLFILL